MAQDSTSIHYGGTLGLAGLAATLLGCAFLAANGPGAEAQAWWPMPTLHVDVEPILEADAPAEELDVEVSADATLSPTPSDTRSPSQPPVSIPEPPIIDETPVVVPAQAETLRPMQATFIVKFKPDPAIDDVIANWRRDREGAIAQFANWAEGDPVFGDMTLEGCSYSGELLLSRKIEAPLSGPQSLVTALTNDIRSHGAVAYADPDFTAHPGGTAEDP